MEATNAHLTTGWLAVHNSTSLCCCGLSSHLASARRRPSKPII